ncbi:MAG TPA: hypothetical protein VK629_16795, partial [Steroidobacteraceae bacterium]|nr:hypothetical protein [Steroidobacteraceae bacterium]
NVADYLARTRDSSRSLVALADKWLKSPRPRVLAWFGDHQPEAAWDFTKFRDKLRADRIAPNAGDAQLQYLTRYQFSANFGPKERSIGKDALDLAYVSSELLHFSGLPLDASATAAKQAAAACKGLMMDCADRELIGDYLSYRVHELHEVE